RHAAAAPGGDVLHTLVRGVARGPLGGAQKPQGLGVGAQPGAARGVAGGYEPQHQQRGGDAARQPRAMRGPVVHGCSPAVTAGRGSVSGTSPEVNACSTANCSTDGETRGRRSGAAPAAKAAVPAPRAADTAAPP